MFKQGRMQKFALWNIKFPRTSSFVSSIFLGAMSDILAQSMISNSIDFSRLSRFMMFRGAMAPVGYNWLLFLERRFPLKYKVKWLQLTKLLLLDQLVFVPLSLLLFFITMAYFEGVNIVEKLKSKYQNALIQSLKVWPLAQIINFLFVPLRFRMPFLSVISVAWNAYLSSWNYVKPEIV